HARVAHAPLRVLAEAREEEVPGEPVDVVGRQRRTGRDERRQHPPNLPTHPRAPAVPYPSVEVGGPTRGRGLYASNSRAATYLSEGGRSSGRRGRRRPAPRGRGSWAGQRVGVG